MLDAKDLLDSSKLFVVPREDLSLLYSVHRFLQKPRLF